MNLVNKLLKRHISFPQFLGYFAANLFGMAVVLLAVQFYYDVSPMFNSEDCILKKQYLVVSKHIGAAGTISGNTNTFSEAEIKNVSSQPFAKNVGVFHSSQYKVTAAMSVGRENGNAVTTDLFFDAVPDQFVDVPKDAWKYSPGSENVPIIMPRSYLTLYNFGFAQSRGLPKVSEGLAGMIDVRIIVNSAGKHEIFHGKVVGFSGRINSILVPLSFMDWSNKEFAPDGDDSPSRLIIETDNPAAPEITQFMDENGYDIADGQLDAGRMTYFLRVVTGIVFSVGLLISILSFYILMLSVYLLVEKNSDKIENLLLIGYSPSRASKPYLKLTAAVNALVLLFALAGVYFVRNYYIGLIAVAYPQIGSGFLVQAVIMGVVLYVIVSVLSFMAIRNKIYSIWTKRRERR